jgi:hypothetical protein
MQGRIKEGKKDKNQILETDGDVKIRGCKSPSAGEATREDEQFSLRGITVIVTVDSRPLFDSGATYNRAK